MAISHVGSADLYGGSGDTIAVTKTISSGNLVVLCIGYWSSQTIDDISDDAGNTYILVKQQKNGSFNTAEVWYAKNVTGQVNNEVTVTFTASVLDGYLSVSEFSGCDTADPLDQSNGGNESQQTTHNAGGITTTVDDEALIGIHNAATTSNWTATTGWADISSDVTSVYTYAEYDIVSSTGTYDTAATSSGAEITANVIASFKILEAAPPAGETGQYVNIGDSFKELAYLYLQIGNKWKEVAYSYVNIGDKWKDTTPP